MPADFKEASSGPRPEQQSASLPSMTTAGTELMPSFLAFAATSASFMSNTLTLQDGQAMLLTSSMVSSQAGHPALKIST
jgi:hypothetical protein